MKITAPEENGLRILLRIAQSGKKDGITIQEISDAEGLTSHNVAKLCRMLRIGGFIKSTRGHAGGYLLARPSDKIELADVLTTLGGTLYNDEFCDSHSGVQNCCNNTVDCSVRSLWQILQFAIDGVLQKLTLQDLIGRHPRIPAKPITLQNVTFITRN